MDDDSDGHKIERGLESIAAVIERLGDIFEPLKQLADAMTQIARIREEELELEKKSWKEAQNYRLRFPFGDKEETKQ